jgi:CHAT domain-containing protein/ribosomal protein L32
MSKEHERLEVLHFAGHVDYNKEKPEETSILLNDGKVTAKYLHDLIEAPPVLVFMNACSSAKESEVSYSEWQGQLTGLASAFIKAGVGAYIGTSWPVLDEPAADLAIEFYKGLHDGKSMGAALSDAQRNLLKSRGPLDLTWAAFTLFGDPRLSFPFSECWTCGKRFMMEDKCEKCGFYRCPHCRNCGCSLSEETRKIVKFTRETSLRARSE